MASKLYKNLMIDDRERITDIKQILAGGNNNPSFEDIENLFLKGKYKDAIDDYFNDVTNWLAAVKTTPEDIVKTYSLSHTGNQMKAGVIAQVMHLLISNYKF